MDKARDIQKVEFLGTTMLLQVDGKKYEIEIPEWPERLAMATQDQRERFEVSPVLIAPYIGGMDVIAGAAIGVNDRSR